MENLEQFRTIPVNSLYYDVWHQRRGKAIIFNHKKFEELYLQEREGTEKDVENLEKMLKFLSFEVDIKNDLTADGIKSTISKYSKMNHSNCDMLWITVLSHGENGKLWAYDRKYKVDELWHPFTGDNCKSLIGKPKLFFIAACRGEKLQDPVKCLSSYDMIDAEPMCNGKPIYYIPAYADLLLMFSTVEKYASFRNRETGTWFIYELCREFSRPKLQDIQKILTKINGSIAFVYESRDEENPSRHQKKQMPQVVHQLTKLLIFPTKTRRNKVKRSISIP